MAYLKMDSCDSFGLLVILIEFRNYSNTEHVINHNLFHCLQTGSFAQSFGNSVIALKKYFCLF